MNINMQEPTTGTSYLPNDKQKDQILSKQSTNAKKVQDTCLALSQVNSAFISPTDLQDVAIVTQHFS